MDLPVLIRAVTAEDDAVLVAFYGSLSPETRYARFDGPGPKGARLREMLAVDQVDRVAVVAMLGDQAIGHALFVRLRDEPTAADVGIVVHDDWQGQGIRTRLLQELASLARDAGIDRFVAEVKPNNRRMNDWLERIGASRTPRAGSSLVHWELPQDAVPNTGEESN